MPARRCDAHDVDSAEYEVLMGAELQPVALRAAPSSSAEDDEASRLRTLLHSRCTHPNLTKGRQTGGHDVHEVNVLSPPTSGCEGLV